MSALPRVSAAEAAHLLEQGYAYVDVRTEPEFAAGHVPGAYNVPFARPDAAGRLAPNPDFDAVMRACFAPDARLVVGCQAGARSRAAAERLRALGYTEVVDDRAGFEGPRDAFGARLEPGWRDEGRPVEHTPAPGRDYAALARG